MHLIAQSRIPFEFRTNSSTHTVGEMDTGAEEMIFILMVDEGVAHGFGYVYNFKEYFNTLLFFFKFFWLKNHLANDYMNLHLYLFFYYSKSSLN